MKDEIILYRPDEQAQHIEVRVDESTETIWLTQKQIADLFGTKRPAITKHLRNIFQSGELNEDVVCSILELTTKHGAITGKSQKVNVKYYNIDAVLSVGYRVNSIRATQFRYGQTVFYENIYSKVTQLIIVLIDWKISLIYYKTK